MAKFAVIATPQERLRSRCVVSDTGCWNFNSVRKDGRANVFFFGGRYMVAYRASFAMHKGPIPTGLQVLHRCDNPRCVNPDHLWVGTQVDNLEDCVAKGRNAVFVGEAHGQAKLTEDDVRAIRAEYAAGGVTLRALASRYGMSVGGLHHIILGRTWTHVK